MVLCRPYSESVATLRRFVDTRSAAGWGAVANALAAGLRQLLSEWALFTAQLEHRALCGALPLQVVRMQFCWSRAHLAHCACFLHLSSIIAATSKQDVKPCRCQSVHRASLICMAVCRLLSMGCN